MSVKHSFWIVMLRHMDWDVTVFDCDVSVEHSLWIVMSLCGRLLLDCDVTPHGLGCHCI